MRQASAQTDPKLRKHYLIIGDCWLKLSQQLSELPADFLKPKRQDQQFTAPLKEGMEEENLPGILVAGDGR
jgi:hypothetical protein